jgi:hypothetical protein
VRFVLNLGLLAGSVAVIIFALQPELATAAVLLRAFVVFVAAVVLATVLVALVRLGRPAPEDKPPDEATSQ